MGGKGKSPMDETKKEDLEVSEEEIKSDSQALAEVKDDDLRDSVAEKFGIDPDEQSELLDKMVESEKAHHGKLSKAIKQKIKHRDANKKPDESEKPGDDAGGDKPEDGDDTKEDSDVNAQVDARFEARDLKELDLPEGIETAVKELSKIRKISVREAAKDPYIASLKEAHDKEESVKNSSPSRNNKNTYNSKIDLSKPLNEADYDLSTQEGVDAWGKAKKAKAEYRKNNPEL